MVLMRKFQKDFEDRNTKIRPLFENTQYDTLNSDWIPILFAV